MEHFTETVEIDLSNVKNMDEFHDMISEKLPCPEFYGRNLDALYDVITGCEEFMVREIVFSGCETCKKVMPKYMAALEQLCIDATKEAGKLTIVFED